MPTLYRKTAAGHQEIETRAGRIPPRARSALILVDGRRTEADLRTMLAQADATLKLLLEAGMIEPVGGTPAGAAVEAAAPAVPTKVDLQARRREAVRALNDLLGPAGDSLAIRIEKASDGGALRDLLERAVPMIGNLRGGAEAARFARRFLDD